MSRSNLAPLLTTFTPPAQCTAYAAANNNVSGPNFYLAQSCANGPHDYTSCWPTALVALKNPGIIAGYGFYSPGTICPSGYYSACTQISPVGAVVTDSIDTSFEFQFPLTAGETAIGCCPNGMTCTSLGGNFQWQTCGTEVSAGALSLGSCGSNSNFDEVSQITISSAVRLWGPLVQLVYRSNDFSTTSNSRSTEISSTGSRSTAGASTESTSTSSANATPTAAPSGELSNGAKIGIGVGVPLAVIFVAAIAAIFYFRKRKRQGPQTPPLSPQEIAANEKRANEYVPSNPPPLYQVVHEVPAPGQELEAVNHRRSELST